MSFARIIFCAGVLTLTNVCPAANLVGTWRGSFEMGKIVFPASVTPEQRPRFREFMDQKKLEIRKARLTFNLKKDGTFTRVSEGVTAKPSKQTGKWKSRGIAFSMVLDGQNQKPLVGTVAKDGKKILFKIVAPGAIVYLTLKR